MMLFLFIHGTYILIQVLQLIVELGQIILDFILNIGIVLNGKERKCMDDSELDKIFQPTVSSRDAVQCSEAGEEGTIMDEARRGFLSPFASTGVAPAPVNPRTSPFVEMRRAGVTNTKIVRRRAVPGSRQPVPLDTPDMSHFGRHTY